MNLMQWLQYTKTQLSRAKNAVRVKGMSINKASKRYGINRFTLQRKLAGKFTKVPGGQPILNKKTSRNYWCRHHNMC